MDDILELIDGALGDGLSPDAVRWSPEPVEPLSTAPHWWWEVWCPFCGDVGFAGERHECPPSPPREIIGLRGIIDAWRDDAYEANLISYTTALVNRQAHGTITDVTES